MNKKSNEIAETLIRQGLFEEKRDVVRFAFSCAIVNNLFEEIEIDGRGPSTGNFNAAQIDATGDMKNLITILRPEDLPYKKINFMVNVALFELYKKLSKKNTIYLSDLIE